MKIIHRKIFKSTKKACISICVIACILFAIIAICTTKRVKETKEYTDRNDIALYIYKYDKLPCNFVTKIYVEETLNISNKDAIKFGYNIGGDTFAYKGSITNMTKNEYLKEADYYPNREKAISEGRGGYRLVYNVYGKTEVFYTENHYGSFEKITKFQLNLISNLFWIASSGSFAGILFIHFAFKNKKDETEALIAIDEVE